jgi:hypothetical protein
MLASLGRKAKGLEITGYGIERLTRLLFPQSQRGFLSVIKRPNLHEASASAEKPGQLRKPGRHCIFRPRLARFHSNNSQIVQEISALVHALRPTFVMQVRSFYN